MFQHNQQLETIYLSGKGYIKNGENFKLKSLSDEFNFSRHGLATYQSFKADRTKFIVTYSIGLGLLIGAIVYHQSYQQVSNVLLVSGVGAVGVSLHFAIRSQNKLSRAVWIRNKDVLIKP